MRRRFVKRQGNGGGRGFRPSREWVSLATGWAISTATSTSAVSLISLQAPTTLALTSDPPEDLTVLRIVGDFQSVVSDTGVWSLVLIVQDTDWTPSATFRADADKRMLWSQSFTGVSGGVFYNAPGWFQGTSVNGGTPREATHVDIAPKVKLEAGKALYLVAFEESGTAAYTTSSANMRMLFQRSGRR